MERVVEVKFRNGGIRERDPSITVAGMSYFMKKGVSDVLEWKVLPPYSPFLLLIYFCSPTFFSIPPASPDHQNLSPSSNRFHPLITHTLFG